MDAGAKVVGSCKRTKENVGNSINGLTRVEVDKARAMSNEAIDLSQHEPVEQCETGDGLTIAHYEIGGRNYIDLDWQEGTRWELLKGVDPEEILSILLKHLYAEEEEIAEITAGIKVLSAEEFEELGGEEFMHALGEESIEVVSHET